MKKCLNTDCNNLTSNPKFCSSSCSAKINNSVAPKRVAQKFYCKTCGKTVPYRKKFCDKTCEKNSRTGQQPNLSILGRKLKDVIKSNTEHQNKYVRIRDSARVIYERAGLPKLCTVCGYENHVHICHRKAIADFDEETLIAEINAISNLIALCPNHHWEFDNGLIAL